MLLQIVVGKLVMFTFKKFTNCHGEKTLHKINLLILPSSQKKISVVLVICHNSYRHRHTDHPRYTSDEECQLMWFLLWTGEGARYH